MKSITPRVKDGRDARWEAHRRRRRRELLRATRDAVHALGAQVSMEEIAAHAGTSKSVFYRYFGDKSGLQQAVLEEALALFETRLLEAVEASADAPAGLRAMVETYLRLADSSPRVYAFSVQSAGQEDGSSTDHLHGFFDRLRGALEHRLREHLQDSSSGAVPPAHHPVWVWPTAALGMVRSAGESWLATAGTLPRASAAELADQLSSWLMDGLVGPAAHHRTDPTPARKETVS